jgi:hypothetical protein
VGRHVVFELVHLIYKLLSLWNRLMYRIMLHNMLSEDVDIVRVRICQYGPYIETSIPSMYNAAEIMNRTPGCKLSFYTLS